MSRFVCAEIHIRSYCAEYERFGIRLLILFDEFETTINVQSAYGVDREQVRHFFYELVDTPFIHFLYLFIDLMLVHACLCSLRENVTIKYCSPPKPFERLSLPCGLREMVGWYGFVGVWWRLLVPLDVE